MTLPLLSDPDRYALFLDFDGTLVALAPRPEDVRLDDAAQQALERLFRSLGGALAIITGRDIAAIDDFLAPLRLPVAGVHGLTRRGADGQVYAREIEGFFAARIEAALAPLLSAHPELLLERKHGAVALHYRARPDLEPMCLAAMGQAAKDMPGTELKRGKMVIEAKMIAGDKGEAIKDFLAEPPFRGRVPVFAGDDVTDEDAFRMVNERDGISIKVADGETCAAFRAAGTEAILAWLRETADRFEGRKR